MQQKILYLSAALMIALPLPAGAHGVSVIYNPYVHEGESAVEAKADYAINEDGSNEDAVGAEATFSHGVTSFWQAEAGVEYEYEENEGGDVTGLVLENKFQFAPTGSLPVDAGFKIDYTRSLTGGPDELVGRLLLAKSFGQFNNIANINVGREIGEDSSDDMEYGFAYGFNYALNDNFAYGVEWHSDFGDFDNDYNEQGHRVGPVIYGNAAGLFEYEAGALIGVSDSAPDAEIKLVLEREF